MDAEREKIKRDPLQTVSGTVEQLVKSRRAALTKVDQPVALISQAPRSGGTLLRNLFDGHPQCHVHPYEWHFGQARRFEWPKLRLDAAPEQWWRSLREEELGRRFISGVRRNPTKYRGEGAAPRGTIYPLLLPPLVHRQLFLDLVKGLREVRGDRDIIDAYLTALFNAWLNNQTLDGEDKRWVVAFAPRLAWGESRRHFFEAYPDGKLISILRDPHSWMSSARGRQLLKGEEDTERLIAMWNRSTEEMIQAKAERGKLVSIVRFEDMVRDAEGVMRLLARRMKIKYDDGLTEPTFNTHPIGANSSYSVGTKQGVITDPLTRHRSVLTDGEKRDITARCDSLYREALLLADRPRPKEKKEKKEKRARPAEPA